MIIRLHDFELSERFLGAKRDITLLEADATLIRLYQRREDSVERSNLLEGDRPAPWQRRGHPRPPDVRERLRNLSEQKRQQQPEMLVDVPENLPDKRAGQSIGNKAMPWARTAGASGVKPDISKCFRRFILR